MAPPSWATEEQWKWLSARKVGWREAKKLGNKANWILKLYGEWAEEWPEQKLVYGDKEEPLTEEEKEVLRKAVAERQKKLRVWYQNHGHRNSDDNVKAPVEVVLPKIKNTRSLQEIELYSKKYYKSRVQPAVTEAIESIKAARNVNKLSSEETLEIVRKCTRQAFDSESPAIREEIAQFASQEKERLHALVQACKTSFTEQERTPEEYQHAIDNAPALIERALAPIRTMTGGIITVLWSGPMPDDGGAIGSFAVHQGQNAAGHNFAQATPNFAEAFVRPHVEFARVLFPRDIRQGRALPECITGLSSVAPPATSVCTTSSVNPDLPKNTQPAVANEQPVAAVSAPVSSSEEPAPPEFPSPPTPSPPAPTPAPSAPTPAPSAPTPAPPAPTLAPPAPTPAPPAPTPAPVASPPTPSPPLAAASVLSAPQAAPTNARDLDHNSALSVAPELKLSSLPEEQGGLITGYDRVSGHPAGQPPGLGMDALSVFPFSDNAQYPAFAFTDMPAQPFGNPFSYHELMASSWDMSGFGNPQSFNFGVDIPWGMPSLPDMEQSMQAYGQEHPQMYNPGARNIADDSSSPSGDASPPVPETAPADDVPDAGPGVNDAEHGRPSRNRRRPRARDETPELFGAQSKRAKV